LIEKIEFTHDFHKGSLKIRRAINIAENVGDSWFLDEKSTHWFDVLG
jgi:hypothetical protein